MSRRGENIFKRKDGRWEARYIHHYENGKAKYRYIYGSSYSEAKAKRLAELRLSDPSVRNISKPSTKFDKLAYLWLSDIKPSIKESSYSRYFRIVNSYLLPHLGDLEIKLIDAIMINRFTEALLKQGGINHQGLSPKTVSDILSTFKSIWLFGSENGFSCGDLSGIRHPQRNSRKVQVLSDDTVYRIEKLLTEPGDMTNLGIVFSLFTGVRIGELCGLKWEDIDLNSGTVTIQRTVERIANLEPNASSKTKVIVSEPKTKCSIRIIPIPQFLCDYMSQYQCENDCFILTGSPFYIEPHTFYIRYKRFLKSNGLESCTFHALRHTFATRCIESGFDEKSLSEILGHSSVTTTMSLYVHPSLKMKRMQMERLTPKCLLQSKK